MVGSDVGGGVRRVSGSDIRGGVERLWGLALRGGVGWRFKFERWDTRVFGGEGKAANSACGVRGTESRLSNCSWGMSTTGENSKSGISGEVSGMCSCPGSVTWVG